MSYDARNRPTFADAPGTAHDIQYTYDTCANGVNKLCRLTRGANTTQYAYNGFGDVLSIDQDVQTATAFVGSSLGIRYDAAGRRQTIIYPGNTRVSYGYDAMGYVNQLTLDRNGSITELISAVVYEPFGPLKALNLGNGLARSIDHDQAYRITAINDPVYDVAFNYDANGNIIYQSRNVGDLDTGYDALDKLTTATGSVDSYAYTYDRNANRLSDTLNGTSTTYAYEPFSNRLNQAGLDPVLLDANGNTTQLRGMTLDYSPDNRLIAANDSNYGYNGMGERVVKTNAATATVYVYGLQGQLMAELDGSGQIEKAYIYLNGQAFAVLDYASDTAGELTYIHTDHLGAPQGLSDESANIVWLADYSPFGLAIVNEDPDLDGNAVTLNLRFPGQYYDQESQLHYNYFRDYDPQTGRYVQSDPIGLSGGLNTYAYVGNNPIMKTDPLGLVEWIGTQTTAAAGEFGGAVIFTFNLETKCIKGKKGTIKVRAGGGAAMLGLPLSATHSRKVKFEDGLSEISPGVFNGQAKYSYISWALGVGGSYQYIQLGGATTSGVGGQVGYDASTASGIGWSNLMASEITECECE
ncbi:MAG: hypothetical protein COA75_14225 [Cellvibrionales bacterium]|nr:MAG: hypothetical protein COA75_14225 [Cellvibrionales bacterium]